VSINGKVARASAQVHVGDEIRISFGNRDVHVWVINVQETSLKSEAKELFEYISS
jgi:ribosomal 50S subunit-recycling heat shock protein